LAVAEAFDAMTSKRPHRKELDFEEARNEILRRSGTQFDPGVVKAFLKIPVALWLELRAEITAVERRFSRH